MMELDLSFESSGSDVLIEENETVINKKISKKSFKEFDMQVFIPELRQ